MAIQNARSNTTGAAPASLADGQIALGQADGILFTRTSAGTVRRLLLPKRAAVADAAYTCQVFDTYVGIASLTASRAITLPAAAGYPVGHPLAIVDESGACSSSVTLTLTAAGSDKINGAATLTMASAYLGLILFSDGASKWTATAIPGSGGATSGALLAASNLSDVAALGTAVANLQQPPASPSASASLLRAAAEQDQSATGTITLTMPNGGAGWRTGVVRNANAVTSLVTLAVPSGATLDGVTNGTTVLFPGANGLPGQRARIIQAGATAYLTDWIDRCPIVAKVPAGTAVASWTLALPAGYQQFLVTIKGILPGTSGSALYARLSDDGFSTVKSGSSDYGTNNTYSDGSSVGTTTYSLSYWYITTGIATGYSKAMAEIRLDPGGGGDKPVYDTRSVAVSSGSVSYARNFFSGACTAISTNRANGLQLLWSSGTGVADITVQGIP